MPIPGWRAEPTGLTPAYRHTLTVPLPDGTRVTELEPLGEPGDRATWTEITTGGLELAVVLLTDAPQLTRDQEAAARGELVEQWFRLTAG